MEQIFVSSVQKELQAERLALKKYVHGDALLRQFFHVFLFEDLPPEDRRPDDLYLDEVSKSAIYLGVFGNQYAPEDRDGPSATEKEYVLASSLRKRRYILVKGRGDASRHPRMKALIDRVAKEVVRRRFEDTPELLRLVYGSLINYLRDRGIISTKDFDAAPCEGATLADISSGRIRWFIEKAREERQYALSNDTSPNRALSHLNLLAGDRPTQGAVLLFSDSPERFVDSAEVTCLLFSGTEIAKPISNQQVYRGPLFEVVDSAVGFVMGALRRAVKPSDTSPASDVRQEVPYPVIREAVVNAVAHRDYASKSGVQVMVFADRVEVWSPGGLPEGLTADQLRKPHSSVPRNRLICEPLFLAHYIERAGTGTLDMIRLCKRAGLPEPEFRDEGERFVVTVWRDWMTIEAMTELGLNEQQRRVVAVVKVERRLTNQQYQEMFEVSKATATRHLDALAHMGVLERVGTTGKGTYYVLARKGLAKGSKGSRPGKGS